MPNVNIITTDDQWAENWRFLVSSIYKSSCKEKQYCRVSKGQRKKISKYYECKNVIK